MLVLTRKYQEKVRIGDGITITILRTKGKAVRLGIEAPAEVPVIRGELTFNELPVESVEKPAKREPRKARRSAGWDANAADTQSGISSHAATRATRKVCRDSAPVVVRKRAASRHA